MAGTKQPKAVKAVIGIILVASFAAAGFLTAAAIATQRKSAAIEAEMQAFVAKSDTQIEAVKARKVAEALARKKAATAASESARLAGLGSTSGATSINPRDCNASTAHNDPGRIDVMVNKKHCMQPLGFEPSGLITVYGATLAPAAVRDFKAMYAAAAAEGQPFQVTSSYRSYASQVTTFNHWVAQSGMAGADTYSARPGYSEHQTGLVIDVAAGGCVLDCFGSTAQYSWFQKNAAQYGFIQRYYKGKGSVTGYVAEEWHYRYVGVEVAKDMAARGVNTLEEYWNMPGGDYETLK